MAKVTKKKYTRDYYQYTPRIELGPSTWIVDTIVLPIVVNPDASPR